jgi:translocation and assembly module TamB
MAQPIPRPHTPAPATTPPPTPRHRVARTIIGVVVLPILLGLAIVLVLALTPWGNERVRQLLVSQANRRMSGQLDVRTLRGNLLSGATLTDVRLVDSARRPLFTARRVQVRYALLPALRGHIVLRSLALDTPLVVLDKQPGARWNFQSLVKPSTRAKDTTKRNVPPELSEITVRHGQMIYRRPWSPDTTLTADGRDSAIAAALAGKARALIERVPRGFQRVLDYHDIDARLPSVRLAHDGQPIAVEIASLSMLGEPYRPPAIDVRSLVGTLYASKDSLWWRGARMALPNTRVVGDGTIRFRRMGFFLDLTGSPLAFADLQWLNPRMPTSGGGKVRYAMRVHGDSTTISLADADLRYQDASIVGRASITRVHPKREKAQLLVDGADLTVARLSTNILHELAPTLDLRRRGTLNGHVAVSGPTRDLRLDADVTFDDAATGRSHVVARGGFGMEQSPTARDLAVQLRPLRLATLTGAGVHVPLGGVLEGDATVSGGMANGFRVRGDVVHVDRGVRSRVVGSGSYAAASKRITADVRLAPLSLAMVNRLVPSARLHGAVTGRVQAEGTRDDLRIAGTLRSTAGGGTLDARGTVALRGKNIRYDVVAATDSFDASALSARAPSTSLTGTIAARGSGTSPATAEATLRLDLTNSRWDTLLVDQLRTRLAVAGGLARIDTLSLVARGAHLEAAGTLGLVAGRNGTLHFATTVDSLGVLRPWIGTRDTSVVAMPVADQRARLTAARADSVRRADAVRIERLALGLPEGVVLALDTLPALHRDSLAGALNASGTVTGNVKQLGVDATVIGTGLVARGSAVRSLHATVAGTDIRGHETPLRFTLRADSVHASGRAFEHVEAEGTWQAQRLVAGVRVRQDSLVSYAVQGAYAHPASGVRVVQLDSLRATFDTLVWRLVHPASVRLDHGGVAVKSLELRSSSGGGLFASASVPERGPIFLNIEADGVRVGTLIRTLQRDTDADGVVSASALVQGTRARPTIEGRAALHDARFEGMRTPDVDVLLGYRDRLVSLNATARDSVGRRVLSGRAALPYDLALADVTGSRRISGALEADVILDSLSLATLPLRSRSYAGVAGEVGAQVHVGGSWRAPLYTGRAGLRGGALTLTSIGMSVKGAMADLSLVGDTLRLDSLVAWARGPMRASGTIDLSNPSHPFVRLSASGEEMRVMNQRRGLVDADAEITAVGPLDALRVTGRGEMLGGYLALKQFRKDLLRVKSPGDLSFVTVFDTTAPRGDSARVALARRVPRKVALIADLTLVIDRGNYYRNRPDANTEFSTGEGEAVVAHIDQRSEDQWIVGFVRIPGGVTYFRTQPFVPARGSLTFGPHTNAVGIVQEVGERMLWEAGRGWFPLQMFTGGTSKAPAIGLESGTLFPIRGRELNGYLTQGRTNTSLLQHATTSLAGSESWSGQLSGLTGALARRQQGATALGVVVHDIGTGTTKEYGLDAFSVSPADVPPELVYGKTGGVRGALVEGGRYMTTDRYMAGQIRLTSGIPGFRIAQRFGTAYRIDLGLEPRFLFRAPEELGITHPTLRTGVFGAFLTRSWDF